EVGDRQSLDLPSFGEHEWSRPGGPPVPGIGGLGSRRPVTVAVASARASAGAGPAALVQAGLQDDGQARAPAAGDADDVAGAQQRERPDRLGPAGAGPGPGQLALAVRQRPAQLSVLGEVALVAGHGGGQVIHRLAVLADLTGPADDAAVGL